MIPGALNPMLLGGGDAGYQIQRSLRFRQAEGAFLNRTYGTPTGTQKGTVSLWVKRGALGGGIYTIYGWTDTSTGNGSYIQLSADNLRVVDNNGVANLVSNALYRDPSGWTHITVAIDTTQATAANRIVCCVNAVQVTSWSTATYMAQNAAVVLFAPGAQYIGYSATSGNRGADNYLAELNFIDGQALTPSSFGQTDPVTGQWTAKKYAGAYGANGFYLPFDDPTSATTLCLDRSGNGNHWTPNNISTAAGRTYDSMLDVPLGSGGGARGNYCVVNTLNSSDPAGAPMENANMMWRADNTRIAPGTVPMLSGKCTVEFDVENFSTNLLIGMAHVGHSFTNLYPTLGTLANVYVYQANAQKASNGVTTSYGATFNVNDVIRLEYDVAAGTLEFFKNNVSQGVAFTGIPALGYVPVIQGLGSSVQARVHVNAGQRPWAGTPTAGFSGVQTANISSTTVITSGSFVGNVSADGFSIWCNGTPETLTINGNAVTWGTHADKTAYGFKLRTSSTSYNSSGSNTWTATYLSPSTKSAFKYQLAKGNP